MSKIIAITNDLYEKLKNMKKENESFSKVIAKSIKNERNVEKILALKDKIKIDKNVTVRALRKGWKWDRFV